MGEVNISNSAGRDAVVTTESVRSALKVRWVDDSGRQASSIRVLKSSIPHDIDALIDSAGDLAGVSDLLIQSDSEIDLEQTGKTMKDTSRVFISPDRKIVHRVVSWEVIKKPDGTERDRRPRKLAPPNISGDIPLRWSGVFIKKEEAVKKFVFTGKVQLIHINGLTYDFLYNISKELEEKNSLKLLGAGPKSNQPLILRRGGSPYRGFLEGRTQGDKYCLTLHFSDMELKAPEKKEDSE